MKYAYRIISLPLVLVFMTLGFIRIMARESIKWVLYGGSITVNQSNDNDE